MQVARLPAAAGLRWVREGFALLRRQPLALLALTFLYLVVLMVTTIVPLVGPFAPMLLTPLLSVGMMHAVRAAERGTMPVPRLLFEGVRDDGGRAWKRLLVLGGVNAVATLLALAGASLVDDGTLLQFATGQAPADTPDVDQLALALAFVAFLLVYTPAQMALWYAPVFTAWHGLAPQKALFYSLAATWRNRAAFVVFMAGWFGAALAASFLVYLLRLALGSASLLMSMVLSPLSLVLLSALYCSFWPTYRDAIRPD